MLKINIKREKEADILSALAIQSEQNAKKNSSAVILIF